MPTMEFKQAFPRGSVCCSSPTQPTDSPLVRSCVTCGGDHAVGPKAELVGAEGLYVDGWCECAAPEGATYVFASFTDVPAARGSGQSTLHGWRCSACWRLFQVG